MTFLELFVLTPRFWTIIYSLLSVLQQYFGVVEVGERVDLSRPSMSQLSSRQKRTDKNDHKTLLCKSIANSKHHSIHLVTN